LKGKSLLISIFILVLLIFIGTSGVLLIKNNRNRAVSENFQKADELLKDSQYNEVLKIFQQIEPRTKGQIKTEILYKMGVCYQKTGDTEKAEEAWNKALNSPYPSYHPHIYWELAQQKLQEKDFEQAQAYYSKITEEFPSHLLAEKATLGPIYIYLAQDELEKAKEYCEEITKTSLSSSIKEIATDKLGEINIKLLFSSRPTEDSEIYSVQMGDSLSKIAREFNTTVTLLREANNIDGTFIKPSQRLKITPGKFSLTIDVKKNELFLNYDGVLFKKYKIATGAKDSPTPTGNFIIKNKMKDPAWYPPTGGIIPPGSPENILGSRWMDLWQNGRKTGYGIHEAINPGDIGKYISNGCIRMLKEDLEELYNILTIGTSVTIR
jgi:lipoprotein-anchoring transpeptidase ErfK/SrfK/outer membrane protein assembly factor BamD (BamD/ComL family)